MTDILFGQSYFLKFDSKLWEAMMPYPPLGTLYAASLTRQSGYDVALFDAMLADSEGDWAIALEREQPRIAVLYEDSFNYLSKMCLLRMRQAAFAMILMAKAVDCTVIVCGSDATDRTEQYLLEGADYVLLGEGELTLIELLDRLSGRTVVPLEKILGLAYRSDDRPERPGGERLAGPGFSTTIRRNPRRPDIVDLDALPFPAWDLVDVASYRQLWIERHGFYSMNLVTTRGCPYHCNWCAKPIWGQRYNSRSPENVVDELAWLRERYDPDHIWFADDIMGLKPGWWQQFADLTTERDLQIPFKCLSRADLLLRADQDVDALARAGCQIVWIGAESGSQKILNAMEKGIRVEQIYEATRRLRGAGIGVGFFVQFGYPGEMREDIEKTLELIWACMPDDVGMSVSYPLPGTQFFEKVKTQLGRKQNWVDSADLDMMYQGPFTTAFYRQLHIVLHKEFRSRKGWRELCTLARNPRKIRARHFREAAAIVYRMATLPLERARLDRLAAVPQDPPESLPHMSLGEAARPTPQSD